MGSCCREQRNSWLHLNPVPLCWVRARETLRGWEGAAEFLRGMGEGWGIPEGNGRGLENS